jgi:predicted ester cyclase
LIVFIQNDWNDNQLLFVFIVYIYQANVNFNIMDTKEELEKHKSQKELEGRNIALAKRIWAEGDNKNLEFLNEVCTPDYKYCFPSNAKPISRDEHKQLWQAFNQAFPDLTHTVEEIYAIENIVVARLTLRGTHKGDLFGILPSGKTIEMGAIEICRFSNNKLAEFWADADIIALYQQIGMELKVKEENE